MAGAPVELNELKVDGFWYLASPYTDPDPAVRDHRANVANTYLGRLLARGVYAYSPIWNCHKAAVDNQLPGDYLWWQGFDRVMIDAAFGVIVLQITGWRESKGVAYEIDLATDLGKPVYYLYPSGLSFIIQT